MWVAGTEQQSLREGAAAPWQRLQAQIQPLPSAPCMLCPCAPYTRSLVDQYAPQLPLDYSNFPPDPADASAAWPAATWGANYPPLAALKGRWDPANAFGKPLTVQPPGTVPGS